MGAEGRRSQALGAGARAAQHVVRRARGRARAGAARRGAEALDAQGVPRRRASPEGCGMTDFDCVDCVADDELAEQEARWQYELAEMETSTNGQRDTRRADGLDVFEFINAREPEYDWLVPEVIERMDRVIVTGDEGIGKSTLKRQVAVKCAAGLHPFSDDAIDPLRVALVDLENGQRHVRRKLRAHTLSAGENLRPGQLTVVI